MNSTFSGVEISKRALFAESRNLNTAGHNISNINTEGYSRQRVMLEATYSLYAPGMGRAETPGQIGQGVDIADIQRQRNVLLDNRIVFQANKEGFWEKRSEYMQRLSEIYNEVGDSSIRSALDNYWSGWQEVSLFPDQTSARIVLIERTETLTSAIRDRYKQLLQVRDMLDQEVVVMTGQINQYAQDIATLNNKIKQADALGDNANDLKDKRDLFIDKLSTLLNVTVDRRDPDELLIHTNGKILIQGDYARQLEVVRNANNATTYTVIWSDTRDAIDTSGGALSAVIRARDEDVRGEIQSLNTFVVALSDNTNELHRKGVSLNKNSNIGFFVETPAVLNVQGNYDSTGDGVFDQTWLYRMTGTNSVQMQDQVGFGGTITLPSPIVGETIDVVYNPTDTVQDVINKINASGAEVVASINQDDRIVVKATAALDSQVPDFVIRTLQDSGEFLAGYAGMLSAPGAAGAYNWAVGNAGDNLATTKYGVAPFLDPAASITINPTIKNDPREVAAASIAQDGVAGKGNGKIALEIASIRTRKVGFQGVQSFDGYFSDAVASIGSRSQEAETYRTTQELIMKKLRDDRAETSKVNLDEEIQDMIKFQTAYSAAARFLTYLNTTYDTLLNMV